MKHGAFINGIGAVTTQGVWRPAIFSEACVLDNAITGAKHPRYKGLIPPAVLRRMSRGIKMGIYAAQQALHDASVTMPGAVITGTGWGCSEDSDKFLRKLWENDEQFLTPTSFVQSTHNTVAAQIALHLQCRGSNVTYVQGAVSFESALLDAFLQLTAGEVEHVLLGGVDEVAEQTYAFLQAIGYIKADGARETVKNNKTAGVNYAEAAHFFTMSQYKTSSTYAEVVDVAWENEMDVVDISTFISDFLRMNNLGMDDIDAAILGYNGDETDHAYYTAAQDVLPRAEALYYKHLSGQFDTCSAFSLAVAAFVLKQQVVPPVLCWEDKVLRVADYKNVLLYNQYRGKDHSLILVRKC